MNPFQMISMLRNGNPQAMVMNMLRQQSGNNPVLSNVYSMAQNGDGRGIEQVARNLCKEKGINADEAIMQIRGQLGL